MSSGTKTSLGDLVPLGVLAVVLLTLVVMGILDQPGPAAEQTVEPAPAQDSVGALRVDTPLVGPVLRIAFAHRAERGEA